MSKGKIIGILVSVALVALCITLFVLNAINNQFRYNEEGAVGNTTGNLYNDGLFCEYKGYIYFANSVDNNSLYRMKSDGTEIQKIHSDSVSYIQIMNDYIYYIRTNKVDKDAIVHGTLHGIYRLEIGEETPEKVYNGIVDTMVICGNYIYFRAYDDSNLIQIKCIKVDGEDLKTISDVDYLPIATSGNSIYFTNVEDNFNLMYTECGSDSINTSTIGNYYMPSFVGNYLYYIDLEDNMQLKRINLRNNNSEILDMGSCINYNVSEETGKIFYQLENSTEEHMLCCMDITGLGKKIVAEGDYCNIHITEKYTYYYKVISADSKELYRVNNSGDTIQKVNFGQINP